MLRPSNYAATICAVALSYTLQGSALADPGEVGGAVRLFVTFDDNVSLVADDQRADARKDSLGIGVAGSVGISASIPTRSTPKAV